MGGSQGEAKGSLFLDDDEKLEMKLGSGYSTYIDFYATISKGSVKIWSSVQESKFALEKRWIIERVTVLGLTGVESSLAIEVDGNELKDTSKVEFTMREHEHLERLEDGGDKMKNVMVEIEGLKLPLGKKFSMSWKMRIKA